MNTPSFLIRVAAAVIALSTSLPGLAANLNVIELPSETSGPFQHNAFHRASGHHGMSGAILAWFALDATDTGLWNTGSGDFGLSVQLYADRGLSMAAGTAVVTGNLNTAAFNGRDGGLLGTIT